MKHARRGVRLRLVGLAAIAGLIAGLVLARTAIQGTAEESIPADIAADSKVTYVLDLQASERHVYALDWARDESLWFVAAGSDGVTVLGRYDTAAGISQSWALPGSAAPGPHTYMVEMSDGSWWVAANYSIWRFDPDSEEVTVDVVLKRHHELQSEAADDPGAPLPGTWVNGMVEADGIAYLTRNNVRALFELSESGETRVSQRLDASPLGLTLLDDRATPYSRADELLRLAGRFDTMVSDAGARLVEVNGCLLSISPAAGLVTTRTDATSTERSYPVQPGDLPRVSSDGRFFAVALSDVSLLIRGDCSGAGTEEIQLAVDFVSPDAPLLRGGHALAKRQEAYLTVRSSIVSLAVSLAGAVAFSDDTMRLGIIEP